MLMSESLSVCLFVGLSLCLFYIVFQPNWIQELSLSSIQDDTDGAFYESSIYSPDLCTPTPEALMKTAWSKQ